MKCVLCRNGETQNGETLFTISQDRVAVIVKNVPAQVCQNCGEAYMLHSTRAYSIARVV